MTIYQKRTKDHTYFNEHKACKIETQNLRKLKAKITRESLQKPRMRTKWRNWMLKLRGYSYYFLKLDLSPENEKPNQTHSECQKTTRKIRKKITKRHIRHKNRMRPQFVAEEKQMNQTFLSYMYQKSISWHSHIIYRVFGGCKPCIKYYTLET